MGRSHVGLVKTAADPVKTYSLAGRLYLSKSGWLLLSVPNSLGRGAFEALAEPGAELPLSSNGQYNAHISIADASEIESIGGPDKIIERGKQFNYTLGPLKEVAPSGWGDVSKCWYISVDSPDLRELRKSYGLEPLRKGYEHHLTVAIRKKNVLRNNDVSKAAAVAFTPDLTPSQLAERGIKPPTGGFASQPLKPGSNASFLDWYHKHSLGQRHDDDAKQMARWRAFRAGAGGAYAKTPTDNRAKALERWGIDPAKLLSGLPVKTAASAVIVKGNPKFISGNPKAEEFYSALQTALQNAGYSTGFDPGEAHTAPPAADLWVGHSRGAGRLRFAPKTTRTLALGSNLPGAINHPDDDVTTKFHETGGRPSDAHYALTPEMIAALGMKTASFEAENDAAREEQKDSYLKHVREGAVRCRCGAKYFVMTNDGKCPGCQRKMYTARGMK